jgi:hypothetical protein
MRTSFDHGSLRPVLFGLAVAVPIALAACSANSPGNQFNQGGNGGVPSVSSATSSTTTSGANGEGGAVFLDAGPGAGGGSGGAAPTCTPGGKDDDVDNDGFTPNEGDCDDCDPFSNPNALEVVATDGSKAKDENCDGTIDEVTPATTCDQGLDVEDLDPMTVPKAVELCKLSTGPKDWGVVSATWVLADGSPPDPANLVNFHLGHGFLSYFGANVKVRAGERMLGLSSGSARNLDDPGYQSVSGFDKLYEGNQPMGFPKESPTCPGTTTGEPHDPTGVEVKIRVPSNAHGFSFDFDFFTFEWPGFICNKYNDFFVALLSPTPAGQLDGNISFDSLGNPVSVNNAFLEICGCEGNPPNACVAGGKSFTCSHGDTDLIGTGFGFDTDTNNQDHGSTGWLQTTAPVEPGKDISLRWAVYDSGDGSLDTTTLIDNWKWLATPGITVGTNPVPH